MTSIDMTKYYDTLPIGAANAVTYDELCEMWNCDVRTARYILHDLSTYDNGDDFVVIRSANGKGFYKTNNPATIQAYINEIRRKGISLLATIKKPCRILKRDYSQFSIINNIRVRRNAKGLTAKQFSDFLREYGERGIDAPTLSKIENGYIVPSPSLLFAMSVILDCDTTDLIVFEEEF